MELARIAPLTGIVLAGRQPCDFSELAHQPHSRAALVSLLCWVNPDQPRPHRPAGLQGGQLSRVRNLAQRAARFHLPG